MINTYAVHEITSTCEIRSTNFIPKMYHATCCNPFKRYLFTFISSRRLKCTVQRAYDHASKNHNDFKCPYLSFRALSRWPSNLLGSMKHVVKAPFRRVTLKLTQFYIKLETFAFILTIEYKYLIFILIFFISSNLASLYY